MRTWLPAVLALLFSGGRLLAADGGSYFCSDTDKPFFSAGPGGLMVPARRNSCARPFPAAKRPGVKRVFVVGESAATILRDGAGEEASSPGLEIINCGMGGYESWRVSRVFSEILSYHPDLVVLLSGNNESGQEPCSGPGAELRRRWRRLLERGYSLSGRGLPAPVRASLAIHERRVNAMAAAARRAGVPLVICALPSNLMMPPSGQLPLEKPGFAAALTAFEKKDYAGALAGFIRTAPSEAFSAYYAGRALYAMGRNAEAARYLAQAEDLSPSQERAGPARNAMLRRAASEHGACAAGLDGAFFKAAGGVTGFGQFDDGVHWRPAYNALAWNTIFSAAAGCGIPAAAAYRPAAQAGQPGFEPAKMISYAASWLDTEGMNARSVAELEYVLARAPAALAAAAASPAGLGSAFERNAWSAGTAARLDEVYPYFAAAAGEAYRRAGLNARALELAQRALAARPGEPAFLLLKGQALYGLGRRAEAGDAFYATVKRGNMHAAEAVAAALGLKHMEPCSRRPSLSLVPAAKKLSDEAAELFASGDIEGAESKLGQALAIEPENPEALSTLCAARVKLREPEAAAACLKAAAAAENCSDPGPERRAMAAAAKAALKDLKD